MISLQKIAVIITVVLLAAPHALHADGDRSAKRTILFNDGSALKIQDGVPELLVQSPGGRWYKTYDRKSSLPFGNAPPGTYSYTRPPVPRWHCDQDKNCNYY